MLQNEFKYMCSFPVVFLDVLNIFVAKRQIEKYDVPPIAWFLHGIVLNFEDGITCTLDNVVYVVACKRFKMVYVGETYRELGHRFL